MNEQQKRLSLIFLFIACSIILAITGIISFVSYESQLSKQGDIFDKVAAEQHIIWISPTLFILIGIAIAAAVLFFGLWKINKSSQAE